LLICTGSQGEPRAALARIAREDHAHIVLEEGDVVIFSSKIIPGNEKAISRLHNSLIRLGVEVVTEEDHFVHVSGHPSRDELTRMYQMVRPRVAIPVHGEARHLLGHAELARQCQVQQALVVENGDMVRLDAAGGAVVDEVAAGRIASDGKSLLPLRGTVLRERMRVGNNGAIVASIVLDGRGHSVTSPQITLIGLAEANSAPAARMRDAVEDALDGMQSQARHNDDAVRDVVRRVLRRCSNELFGKRPLIEIPLARL